MALSKLIKDEEAQEAHAFIVGILDGMIDCNARGFGARMRAAQDVVRFWQTQERHLQSPADEHPQVPGASHDFAGLSDEELEARVAPIIEFPRVVSTGA